MKWFLIDVVCLALRWLALPLILGLLIFSSYHYSADTKADTTTPMAPTQVTIG